MLPVYLSFQAWLASQTNREKADKFFDCIGFKMIVHVGLEGNMPIIQDISGLTVARVIAIVATAIFGIEVGLCIEEVFFE